MLELKRVLARSVVFAGVVGGSAAADTPTDPAAPMPQESSSGSSMDTLKSYGVAMALGGGVEGFTNESARDATNDGGNWNVRVAIGTKLPVGFEAAYIGSAQSIDALGLDTSSVLVGNGVQGLARVNLVRGYAIQPFAFAGIGWRHYSLANTDTNTSDIEDTDDVLEIPMGAGVAYTFKGLLLDARGEFRYSAQEDLMPSLSATDPTEKANLHRWGVNANIGFAF